MSFCNSDEIIIKTAEQIEKMAKAGQVLQKVLQEVKIVSNPGVSTGEVDQIAEEIIRSHNMKPSFKGYHGFPGTICASIDDEVVHTFPSKKRILEEGQIFKVDCGVCFEGWHSDACITVAIGKISKAKQKLMDTTKKSLYMALDICKEGVRIGNIGALIEKTVKKEGYNPVRQCVGHGIGNNLHEAPQLPNFGENGTGAILKENMTICIEPIINMGSGAVYTCDDKWCVKSKDGLPSAHFEHTICIEKKGARILA